MNCSAPHACGIPKGFSVIFLVPMQEFPLPCEVESVAGEFTGELSTAGIIQILLIISLQNS